MLTTLLMLALGVYVLINLPDYLSRLFRWFFHRKLLWSGSTPHPGKLEYVSTTMAVRPTILGHPAPLGYRLACLYFRTGLIDRTETLDHGFPYQVLDALPRYDAAAEPDLPTTQADAENTVHAVCQERANAILDRARAEKRNVRILWSGGIDSTAAACALLQNSNPETDKLEFYYGRHSRAEYNKFFKDTVRKYPHVKVKSVGESLDCSSLLVTGEHGDQLFGSLKAIKIGWSDLMEPWQEAFPKQLRTVLASSYRADQVIDYLSQQFRCCPVPIVTLLDLLWWLNYSLKWQSVSLRIPLTMASSNNGNDIRRQLSLTEHFFRDPAFELWAFRNRQWAITPGDWKSYKRPLKKVIFEFNNDQRYLDTKRKVPSLMHVTSRTWRYRSMAWDQQGSILYQHYDDSLRKPIAGFESKSGWFGTSDQRSGNATTVSSAAIGVSYIAGHESGLWSGIDNDGG